MRTPVSLRAILAFLPVVGAAAACSSEPPAEPTRSQSQGLGVGVIAFGGGAGSTGPSGGWTVAPPATTGTSTPPPTCPPPPVCQNDPKCSFGYSADTLGDANLEAVRQAAGCGPVYHYSIGAGDGFLGGVGSFCPDTPANRAYLRANVALAIGYDSTYCDQCLTVPSGSLFFFWPPVDLGPGCPSGCMLGALPPHI